MSEFTRDAIIDAAREAAEQSEQPLSRSDFERVTGISHYHIYKLFPDGGWSEIQDLAGLEKHPRDNRPLTDEDLLEEYHRVASEMDQVPTWMSFSARAEISSDVVRRRFGGLQGTLRRYRQWLEANDPESPLLQELKAKSRHEIPMPPPASGGKDSAISSEWEGTDGPVFGAPINFRGLRHAPINELGVVFLFGMVSYELGFVVEAVHATFPDCEAKRCVDRRRDRWQRVRIEFEYSSRNFRRHGHDPTSCDVIVCWEHDWPECPIEVIELRRVIGELDD